MTFLERKERNERLNDLKTLKWIFEKTKSQAINFILLNLINMVYSVLSIYLILISKHVIDAAASGTMLELKKYIVQLIMVTMIEIGLKAILASIHAVTQAKLEMNFKQDVLHTILKKNYEQVTKFHSGELMTRIVSDVNLIIDTLVELIPSILSMITRLVCAIVLLFQISKEFVFALLLGGLVLFVVVNVFKPYLKNIHKKMQEAGSNVRLFFQEVLNNLLVIKIFQAEEMMLDKSVELQNKRYDLQMKRRGLAIASGTGYNVIFQVCYLFALIWSTYNLYWQKITVGGVTSIVQLINQVQSPIIGLSRSFQNMFGMIGSAERIMELERLTEDVVGEEIACEELYDCLEKIVMQKVDFTYKNKKIFEDANFVVNKGEIVAIYGESGIGKSTLLKLVLGIIEKDQGEVYFALKDGKTVRIGNDTRKMFAYVPQGKFILSGTIRENITFVNPQASEKEMEEALDVSDCKRFVEEFPRGLDTEIGEKGSGLSEGQLQRLALARAILSQAPILILDEITSSLDSKTEEEVLRNIKRLKNRTCLIVTHRNSISKICDREFVVENKKIREKEKEDEGSKGTT